MKRELFDRAEIIVDGIREQERNIKNFDKFVQEGRLKIGTRYDRMIELPDDLAESVSKVVVSYFEQRKQRLQAELDGL